MSKKVLIGLDMIHYALLNSDTTAGASYQTPVAVKGAITVAVNPNSEIATLFADDGAYETEESTGEIELDMGIADISQEDDAAILGKTITGGVCIDSKNDTSAELAFGFRAKRSSGGYSYVWLLKGKFAKPSMDHETKGDSINWQTPVYNGKFVNRIFDDNWRFDTRTDADNYVPATGSGWFDAVYATTADSTAPTVSSTDPSASATSSSQTANISIVFSEPMQTSTLTAGNITILLATAATTISATYSASSATVTLDHDNSLTASTTYNVILSTGLKDLAGNAISAQYTWAFTTSA